MIFFFKLEVYELNNKNYKCTEGVKNIEFKILETNGWLILL